MTLGEFRKWSASLPDNIEVGSMTRSGAFPLAAKRAALITWKEGRDQMIVVNPMGTHFPDPPEHYDITSTTCGHNVDAEGKAIA